MHLHIPSIQDNTQINTIKNASPIMLAQYLDGFTLLLQILHDTNSETRLQVNFKFSDRIYTCRPSKPCHPEDFPECTSFGATWARESGPAPFDLIYSLVVCHFRGSLHWALHSAFCLCLRRQSYVMQGYQTAGTDCEVFFYSLRARGSLIALADKVSRIIIKPAG